MIKDKQTIEEKARATAHLLRAMSNPHRLLVLCYLYQHGEVSAGELAERLGLSASSLSQHLSIMREVSLVDQRRESRIQYYRVGRVYRQSMGSLLGGMCDTMERSKPDSNHLAAFNMAFTELSESGLDSDWSFPKIKSGGGVCAVTQGMYPPSDTITARVVFTLAKAQASAEIANNAFMRVARCVNLYASGNGLEAVVSVSGAALDGLLNNAHYMANYKVENPNREIIEEMLEQGIKVVACGQALKTKGYPREWLLAGVDVSVSALSTMIELQQQGYALMPL